MQNYIPAEPFPQKSLLNQKIIQLQTELLQKQSQQKQTKKQLHQLSQSHNQLNHKVQQYRNQFLKKTQQQQKTVQDKNIQISLLKAEMSILQENNNNLHELLRKANQKIIGLTRQLTNRNRFIKEYLEHEDQQEI